MGEACEEIKPHSQTRRSIARLNSYPVQYDQILDGIVMGRPTSFYPLRLASFEFWGRICHCPTEPYCTDAAGDVGQRHEPGHQRSERQLFNAVMRNLPKTYSASSRPTI